MKFILVMLAVLLPVGVMLAELDSKANLIDTVSMSSGGGRILLIGGYTIVGSTAIVLGTTELYDPATNSFLPLDQTASTTLGVYLSTATFLNRTERRKSLNCRWVRSDERLPSCRCHFFV